MICGKTQSLARPIAPLLRKTLYTLGLYGLLLSHLALPAAFAKNTPAPATSNKASTNTKTTPAKTAKKEAPPVISEETRQAIEQAAQKLNPDSRIALNHLSDALHLEDRAVYNELRDDEELSITDIGMLWEAAVERSGTIRYAIEKLSRKDATGKPVDNDSFTKRVVQNMVHLGGVAGTMWTGTPAGLIGSNMVQDLISGNPQDSALSRVTDADMVILAKEVEALQSQLIEKYYTYRHAEERLSMAREASATIGKYYDHAQKNATSNGNPNGANDALQPLMLSMLDTTTQEEQNALQTYNSTRSALSLMVGPDAIAALDQSHSVSK